jgi:hypothetical protein
MQKKAVYRILLTVRGKLVVKEYKSEREWKRWQETFEWQWRRSATSGIERVEVDKVYR